MAITASKISIFCLLVFISCSLQSTAKEEKSTDLVDRLLRLLRERKDNKVPVTKVGSSQEKKLLSEDQLEEIVKKAETRAVGVDGCHGQPRFYTATTGTISTPRYGIRRYPDSANCWWIIKSNDTEAKIKLKFSTPFSIEKGQGSRCSYDYLAISDGDNPRTRPFGQYCNSNPPQVTINRDANTVSLHFVSDFSVSGTGFTLDYTILPGPPAHPQDGCTGVRVLKASEGVITSQNYPDKYGNSLHCQWRIIVPRGKRVRLDVQDFKLEGDISCSYDSLSIYDGQSTSAKLIDKYCGTAAPADITTSGNTAFLVFVSDSSIPYTGFKIRFSGLEVTTPPPVPGNPPPTEAQGAQVDLSCTFEEGNMCMWRRGAGGNINWNLKSASRNTYIIGRNERWGNTDHTTGSSAGHYIVIDGGQQVTMANTRGYLVSPELSAGPAEGRCLSLWYNMYYTKGVLQVVMRREGEGDEVIWQRDGFQGNGWHQGRISLVSSAPYRLVLVGSRGTTDKETGIGVDDISFESTPCLAIPLNCGRSTTISKRSFLDAVLHPAPVVARGLPSVSRRILGGQPSGVGMWPWIVNIRTTPPGASTFMSCGGSLIDRQWIVSAAHCFEHGGQWLTDPINIELRLGEANVGLTAWEDSQINIRPSKVFIHPQRAKSSMGQVAPYDLALLKLPFKVDLSNEINVVCLPPAGTDLRPGAGCVVSGWGKTGHNAVSDQLLHVDLELLNMRTCRAYFGNSIGEDVLCARNQRQIKAACRGDSGGPLVCRNGDHYILVGAVSWGVPCSEHDQPLPSVFAKITYFLPWIESTINSEQQ